MKNDKFLKNRETTYKSDAEFLRRTVKELYDSLSQLGALVLQLQLSSSLASSQPLPPPSSVVLKASSTMH